ncbi:uncharacterized protein [Antedon mediterranea]|uniref:uncharacterized protein n=1 Tax=Antedon mediterranea TaxID=105859 RepID=UPI003AF43425
MQLYILIQQNKMSRSVKDLRELVCVSRLTIRESDDEYSDDESLVRPFSSMSILSDGTTTLRENSAKVNHAINTTIVPKPPSTAKQTKHKFKKAEIQFSGKVSGSKQNESNHTNDFKLAKKPLPPVQSSLSRSINSDEARPLSSTGNFDNVLEYMDESCVESFLKRANQLVNELSSWCHNNYNFVHFANFWLQKIPDRQKLDLYKLEIGIINDELRFAFQVGIEQQKVKLTDLRKLVSAVVREYPTRLCTLRGPYIFLDILDTLTSDRTDAYKELLTDVKISTRNRKFAQWMLATRAFALLNIWTAAVNFYRRLISDSNTDITPIEEQSKDTAAQRVFVATGQGYVHFLHYYFKANKISADVLDTQKRSLVFEAVTKNQETALLYLLTKVKPRPDINNPADSGNMALHTAANMGSMSIVRLLLEKGNANVNCKNVKCDDATPLHLAVMQGHQDVCQLLIEAGADVQASMGGITPLDLANDMGHTDVTDMISKMTESQSQSPMEES